MAKKMLTIVEAMEFIKTLPVGNTLRDCDCGECPSETGLCYCLEKSN